MKTKKLFLAIILFAGMSMQASAATFTVTDTTDAGAGSLRQAILDANAAAGADTIVFNPGVSDTITLASALPQIAGELRITGPGANILSVSGNNAVRVFDILNVNVIISGLSIIDGYTVDQGGGIMFSASPFRLLSIFDCTFSGNSAMYGGAIETYNGNLTVTGSTFEGNSASVYGGAINADVRNVVIINSTFTGNSASRGGAIHYVGNQHPNNTYFLSMTNCTVSGNTAHPGFGQGGGIVVFYTPGLLSNTIVAGNSAPTGPDVVSVSTSFTSLGYNFIGKSDGSTGFTNGVNNDQVGTIAAPIDPMLSALANNGGPTYTMALQCGSPAVNAALPATTTSDQRGFAVAGGRRDIGAFELQRNHIVTSTADSGPGTLRQAIANACNGDTITFTVNDTITLASALPQIAGDLRITGPGANILSVSGNNAARVFDILNVNVIISGLSIIDGYTVDKGGGIRFSASSLKLLSIFDCTFSGNSAIYGGAIETDDGNLTVTGSTFEGNSASVYGGAIAVNESHAAIINSTFTGNSAGQGGAIQYTGEITPQVTKTLTMTNCTVSGNTATNVFGVGGGIIVFVTPGLLSNTIVAGNSASTGPDVFNGHSNSFTSQGYNFIGKSDGSTGFTNGMNDQVGTIAHPINPMLSALANNGGPTYTMALQCSSPAINTANPATTTNDQRGFAVAGGRRDIGAFEFQAFPQITCPSNISASADAGLCGTNVSFSATATGNPAPVVTYSSASGSFFAVGTTTVTVTATINCKVATCTFDVTVSDGQAPQILSVTSPTNNGFNVACNGGCTGSATVSATDNCSGTLTYLWSNSQTGATATNLCAGPYTVTVTDANGNTATSSKTLTQPSSLTIDAGPNKIVYKGYPDSSCTRLQSSGVGGGVAPRTLLWSTGSTASFINVCPTVNTTYYLTVTDANGCTKKDSVRVCVIDVRCGSGNTKVRVCHGTGSVSNPFQTLCISKADAKWHFLNHPGEQLGTCGMNKTCSFPARLADEEMQHADEQETGLTAYPNPTSGEMNISFQSEKDEMYLLRVISVTGQVLLSEMKQSAEGVNKYTLNLKEYAPGIYMVLLNSGDNMRQIRIVKE